MRKGGLINVFNLPIKEQRELSKVKNYRKNSMKMSKVNHHKIIKKNLNKFGYHLNMSTIEEYQTISVISSMRNISVKYLVNNPEVKGNI